MIFPLCFIALASLCASQTTPASSTGTTKGTAGTTGTTPAGLTSSVGDTSASPGALTTTCWCRCLDEVDRKSKTTGACTADRCPDCLHDVCARNGNGGVTRSACSHGFVCSSAAAASDVSSCAELSCGATDKCDCISKTIACAAERGCTIEPQLRSDCSAACPAGGATNGDADLCTTKCTGGGTSTTPVKCTTDKTATAAASVRGLAALFAGVAAFSSLF